jgi:hypothetical protein
MARKPASKLSGADLKKEGATWIERINAAWERERVWEQNANQAQKAYTNEAEYYADGVLYDYNILHSNVETIVPAIINSPPVPDIRRRFGDDDPVGKQLSELLERVIRIQIDDGKLAGELESQAQDGFLAGRGIVRLRFYADVEPNEVKALEDAEDKLKSIAGVPVGSGDQEPADDNARGDGYPNSADDESKGYEGTGDDGGRGASVSNERICYEAVSWRDYQHGPAKRWDQRPWESFRHVCESYEDIADPTYIAAQTDGVKPDESADSDKTVYEIWDKKSRKVIFVSGEGLVLKKIDDPLNLSTFFPTGTPVQPLTIVGRLMPVNPFSVYKKLADELDVITKRIRKLTAAMQIKGGFVGAVGDDLKRLADAEDNELIAIAGVEAAAQAGGLDKLISWWPAERFVSILAELFKNRDLTKQAIYEITGISDIVRGASKASETLGAQQIKSQWGSLRIKKMQTLMANSARDLMGLSAEIIVSKFSHARLTEMTGIEITPELAALMNNKALTSYRVDVETDSTVRADLTQKKTEMAEFLTGTGQYFASMQPVVAAGGPAVAEPLIEIYAAATRNYDLGKSAEDALDKLLKTARDEAKKAVDNPQPPPPNPDVIKAQADAQATQAKLQMDQAKLQGEGQKALAEFQLKQQAAQADVQERQGRFQMEQQAQQATQAMAREELQAKIGLMQQETQAKIGIEQTKAQADAIASQADLALKRADLEIKAIDMQIKMKDLELKQKQIDAPAPKPGATK